MCHLLTLCCLLVDPLLVFEMIHRIIDILVDYLGDVSEVSIRDNFVTVYQVREDVLLNNRLLALNQCG